MRPRAKPRSHEPTPVVIGKAHPCWAGVRAGLEEAERGDTITLTNDEADAWAETGKLPERVHQWHDERSRSRCST